MRILVPIKRVIDPYVKIQIKSDRSGVETQQVKMAMNPFDEIAVEEAIRLKEKNQCEFIQVLSIGDKSCQETLRNALALGADEAIHIMSENHYDPIHIAKLIQAFLRENTVDLILMGKQAIDGDNNQSAQYLAALLGWPQALFASKIELDSQHLVVTREVDGGLETVRCTRPAVISTDLRLNEPRYPTLPNIMKAKKKPLKMIEATSLSVDFKQHTECLEVNKPASRQAGVMLASVEELLDILKNKEKVI